MIYGTKFSYTTSKKGLEHVEDIEQTKNFENALIAFIHVEPEDEQMLSNVQTKLVKNLKWVAHKNETNLIVLHSFAHLAEKKGDPDLTKAIFDNTEELLKNAGFDAEQKSFGYFWDMYVQAPGHPFARLFKEFE